MRKRKIENVRIGESVRLEIGGKLYRRGRGCSSADGCVPVYDADTKFECGKTFSVIYVKRGTKVFVD